MKLIKEHIEDVKYLTETTESGKKNMYIEGRFLVGDEVNRNNRMYKMDTLRNEVERYTEEYINTNRALGELGHDVTYLVAAGSSCPFAKVLEINPAVDLRLQIPNDIEIVHFQFNPTFDLDADFDKPYVVTEHGNTAGDKRLPLNSIFVSRNHAQRHRSEQFVYNGLNWNAYGPVNFDLMSFLYFQTILLGCLRLLFYF